MLARWGFELTTSSLSFNLIQPQGQFKSSITFGTYAFLSKWCGSTLARFYLAAKWKQGYSPRLATLQGWVHLQERGPGSGDPNYIKLLSNNKKVQFFPSPNSRKVNTFRVLYKKSV